MNKIGLKYGLAFGIALSGSAAQAADATVALHADPARDTVEAMCAACHSTNYIPMNSPFLTTDMWRAEVTKMRVVFGAPIDDGSAADIVAYLGKYYGK